MLTSAQWNKKLVDYSKPDSRKSTVQLLVTLFVFSVLILCAHLSYKFIPLFCLPFSLLAGMIIIKLFTIQHDCGHRSFFSTPQACDWVGRMLSVLTLTPYDYWRRDHDKHHATSGNLDNRGHGDIITKTLEEYRSLSWTGRTSYRLYRHPAVLFGLGPLWQFILRYRFPVNLAPRNRWRQIGEITIHNCCLAVFFSTLCVFLGWHAVAAVWLPALSAAAIAGVWLFFVQHQYENAYWVRREEWSFVDAALNGCSYYKLPRWLHWLTGNIGYHHIHHLSSRIPNYRLAKVFDEIPELQNAPAVGMRESLRYARLALWCENTRRLISFREAHMLLSR